jgi:uncharacterized protein with von Willebrand factor type A (vWA) domain
MGMRELMERLRQRRREQLERHDLGGVYEDIAQQLREVVDTERQGLDDLAREARESGDARRQEITDEVVPSATSSSTCCRPTWRAWCGTSSSTSSPRRRPGSASTS